MFCNVLSIFCGTVVEENEKHMGIEIRFWTPWTILRFKGPKFLVLRCVTEQQGFTTCCLYLWCRCLWRVSSSRSKKGSNFLFFTLISSPLPLYTTIYRKNENRMPGTQGKRELEISGSQGWPATLYLETSPSEVQQLREAVSMV